MTQFLAVVVALLFFADILILNTVEKLRAQPAPPPDLTPRVVQLEKDLSQAQQDLGEVKQEIQMIQRRGQPTDQ